MTSPATTPLPPAAARPAPGDGEHEAEGDQREAERHGTQDRACVSLRALTGSQPPDEEARKGEEPERHEPPIWPPATLKGEHHADRDDEQQGAGDHHAALGAFGRLAGLALVGDEEDGGEVGEDACATEEDERHGADAHEDRVMSKYFAMPAQTPPITRSSRER